MNSMSGYIAGFTVYTLAITGIIFLAFVIAKKTMMSGFNNCKNQFLAVETSLSLSPRKTIHVVKAGNERFLISTDAERTTFLTKLDEKNLKISQVEEEVKPQQQTNFVGTMATAVPPQQSIMRNILEKLSTI